jgi:VWFA-related protein
LPALKTLAYLLATSAALAQSPAVFRGSVRVVTVPTTVLSRRGEFVRGMEAGDFSLFDNDRRQKIRLDYTDQPLSVAIAVQNNDAVRAWLPQVRRVASTIEALLTGETGEASVTTFGDEVKFIQPLTESSALLDKAFQSITASNADKSRTLDAVVSAAKQLEHVSPARRRVVLLIAESGDRGSESSLRDALRELEWNNIAVCSLVMPRIGGDLVRKTISIKDTKSVFHRDDIGFVGSVDLGKLIPEIYRAGRAAAGQDELAILTGESGGREIPFRKLRDLEKGIAAIGEELHTEYVLSYTPDRYDPGYHRIRVQVARPDAVVRSRPGYYVLRSDVIE